jgi:hypothetical protein
MNGIRVLDVWVLPFEKGGNQMKLLDQIQRLKAHILHPNCRETICGVHMVKRSLTRTVHGEYVFGDVNTIITMDMKAGYWANSMWDMTEEELVKPFICEECLAREIPSVDLSVRPSPYRMIQANRERLDYGITMGQLRRERSYGRQAEKSS